MPIKNYTTTISVEKSVMEIQKALAKHKARAILTEYDGDGVLTHLAFQIETVSGRIPFRLPAQVDRVYVCLQRSKVPRKLKTREQAARVAWRVIKDWVMAQLAIVEADMVDMVEVFLPYAQDSEGETIYTRFIEAPQRLLKAPRSTPP